MADQLCPLSDIPLSMTVFHHAQDFYPRMDQINTTHTIGQTLLRLWHLIIYAISPSTLILGHIVQIYHPNVNVIILGLAATIFLTVAIASIHIQDPFSCLFQWIIWNVAWLWLLHSECSMAVSQVAI